MVGWHHRLNGHEFRLAPGVGDGQGGLACCSSWVSKTQMTVRLNCTELKTEGTSILSSLIAQWVKSPPAKGGEPRSIPWLGRSFGEGIGYPPQYSWNCLVAWLVKNLPAM